MATIGWWSKSILPPLNMVEDVADQYKAALGGVLPFTHISAVRG